VFNIFKKFKEPEKPLIEVWTQYGGLEKIDLVRPVWSAKDHMPKWWKKGPSQIADQAASMFEKTQAGTYKSCPGIQDFFKDCLILPMWTDVIIAADGKGDWAFKCSMDSFKIELHDNNQFLNHVPPWLQDVSIQVFKFPCPWLIKTPPGYSVMQLPMFYHFDRNFQTMAGVIRTDIYHEINQQVCMMLTPENAKPHPDTNMHEIMIKAGTPMSMYIPFKREEYDLDIRDSTKDDYNEHMTSRCAKLTFQQGYRTILQKQQTNQQKDAEGTLGREV
tara:strand:- start:283 stop:1107 length:825 start_codon:yes stop_codon:yes gene_type:complete